MIKQRIAFKAVITDDTGRALILREASTYDEGTQKGRYTLTGGRLEPGESWQDGLRREIHEETGLEVEIGKPLYVGEWRPVIKGVHTQIIAVFMLCSATGGVLQLSTEHDLYEWVSADTWRTFDVVNPDDKVLDVLFNKTS
jgi:ADP-ribose pyrophosphatase YjhB (NUDIX family)